MSTELLSWASTRLTIRVMPHEAVEAVVKGHRLAEWADDFPAEGDVRIAGGVYRREIDQTQRSGGEVLWGHHQVIETSSGLVIGGIGFHRPPNNGEVEIGYGIVVSRQGRGYATEAVQTLVSAAWSMPSVLAVLAGTDDDNVASQRVLEKAGFRLVEKRGGGRRYRIERALSGAT
jgi:RimJ/RimL family protein N-acetyltransferase